MQEIKSLSTLEASAIRKVRAILKAREVQQSNNVFNSLFSWGGEQQRISKTC